jgi:hypothetical protein
MGLIDDKKTKCRKSRAIVPLKGQCHQIFEPRFFHQTIPPRALIHGPKPFCIWLRIRRENRFGNRQNWIPRSRKIVLNFVLIQYLFRDIKESTFVSTQYTTDYVSFRSFKKCLPVTYRILHH